MIIDERQERKTSCGMETGIPHQYPRRLNNQ